MGTCFKNLHSLRNFVSVLRKVVFLQDSNTFLFLETFFQAILKSFFSSLIGLKNLRRKNVRHETIDLMWWESLFYSLICIDFFSASKI